MSQYIDLSVKIEQLHPESSNVFTQVLGPFTNIAVTLFSTSLLMFLSISLDSIVIELTASFDCAKVLLVGINMSLLPSLGSRSAICTQAVGCNTSSPFHRFLRFFLHGKL